MCRSCLCDLLPRYILVVIEFLFYMQEQVNNDDTDPANDDKNQEIRSQRNYQSKK